MKHANKKAQLKIDDNVLINNEMKTGKMENEFEARGKVTKKIYENVYEVVTPEGQVLRRQISQLRRF